MLVRRQKQVCSSHNPKVAGSNPTPATSESRRSAACAVHLRVYPTPTSATGPELRNALTCMFVAFEPVDVYRLGEPTSVANCSAAAAPIPGRRCW